MPNYRLTWEIDIFDAENPRAAARAAQLFQKHPGRGCFSVTEHDTAETTLVDLDEPSIEEIGSRGVDEECEVRCSDASGHLWVVSYGDDHCYCVTCGAEEIGDQMT
jgi:hypothetical protein